MRRSFLICLSLAVAVTFLAIGAPTSVTQTTSISGRITVEGRERHDRVIVWLDADHVTMTDSLGEYEIGGLEEGEYVVRAWSERCLVLIIDTVLVSGGGGGGVDGSLFAGDVVQDGRINLFDAGEILKHYHATPDSGSWDEALDLDNNSVIDSLDCAVLMGHWREVGDLSEPPTRIVVTEPDGAAGWNLGQRDVPIRWETGGLGGDVRIELFRGDIQVGTISPATANDGLYCEYDVPMDLVAGTDYRIGIFFIGGSYYDYSEYFGIQQSQITVIAPNGDSWWYLGREVPICWGTGGIGGTVSISLYKGDNLVDTIATAAANEDVCVVILYGVEFIDVNTGTAVGDNGLIYRTTDGGDTWQRQTSNTGHPLIGVSFTDVNTGTAVGYQGTILRTTDGGATWVMQSSGTDKMLYGVSFADPNTGIVVGEGGLVLRTQDGGATWTQIPGGTGTTLRSISLLDANTGTVVGYEGTVLRTADCGATWEAQTNGICQTNSIAYDIPTYLAPGTDYRVEVFRDEGHSDFSDYFKIEASGDFEVIEPNGATVWTTGQQNVPIRWSTGNLGGNVKIMLFQSMFDDSPMHGMDVIASSTPNDGSYDGYDVPAWLPPDTDYFVIIQLDGSTYDYGEEFEIKPQYRWTRGETLPDCSDDAWMYGVSFTDGDTGTVVGYEGTILRTTDGGATWMRQESGTSTALRGVSFANPQTGTIVGYEGLILRTVDGGETWVPQPSATSCDLYGVMFTDPDTGTAVGDNGTILRTADGGATWAAQASGTAEHLRGVSFTDSDTGTAVGAYGTILRTTDGGAIWAAQESGTDRTLRAVSFTGANTGTAVGDSGTVLRTADGGDTWLSQSSGTDFRLYDVMFTDDDTGTAVGECGTIIRTLDGGDTWTIQRSGSCEYGFEDLWSVSFTDADTGTVVGHKSHEGYYYGLILRTTDGGETWIKQEYPRVFLDPTYETSPGFFGVSFTDANTGTIAGQCGFILRTVDGGASWFYERDYTGPHLWDVFMLDAQTAIAVGDRGTILKRTRVE